MWVKLTSEELRVAQCRRWRELGRACALGVLLLTPFCTLCRGWQEAHRRGGYLVSPEEWSRRWPYGVAVGIVFGGLLFWEEQRKKVLVCLTCGKVKNPDKSPTCCCGGELEDIQKLRWFSEEPIKCLACAGLIPATEDTCPHCGWTYKEKPPAANASA